METNVKEYLSKIDMPVLASKFLKDLSITQNQFDQLLQSSCIIRYTVPSHSRLVDFVVLNDWNAVHFPTSNNEITSSGTIRLNNTPSQKTFISPMRQSPAIRKQFQSPMQSKITHNVNQDLKFPPVYCVELVHK